MFFPSIYIFLLSISFITAVPLDGDCQTDTQCEGLHLVCRDKKCQCNAPSYIPCKSLCILNSHNAYEGEHCEVQENCIANTVCSTDKRCKCRENFTAKNGLCLKNLNLGCTNHTECWSGYCSNSQCQCAPGYEPYGDHTGCRPKLVNVYDNWNDANQNNAICFDSTACIDHKAICTPSSSQPSAAKYCKCPDGHQAKDENKRCEPNEISTLSPLDSVQLNYIACGTCKDNNAACIQVGAQKTCWCRSGYVKNGDRCEQRMKSLIIFPNLHDLNLHDFTNNCLEKSNGTSQIDRHLCVCAPDYEYDPTSQSCVRIQRDWTEAFEYGICTRINSKDEVIGDNGLCPEPLKCEERTNKHVCSCGENKFRDLNDPTQCVYYIGKTTNTTDDRCPTKNAKRNNATGVCECFDGYRAVNRNRECALILATETFGATCNANRTDNSMCESLFGNKAILCTVGECRCSGQQSFTDSTNTYCYAPLNEPLREPKTKCPLNSTLDGNQCRCNSGYRPSNDLRQCTPVIAQLVSYAGPSKNLNNSLTTQDCQALYTGSVEVNENNRCQCTSDSFLNDDITGCWYRVNTQLQHPPESLFCPPYSSTGSGMTCRCDEGYISTSSDEKCVRATAQLYADNDPTALIVPGLTDVGCRKWYGNGAQKSTYGDYCVCKTDAYLVESNSYCHFFINAKTNDIKGTQTCPANTEVSPSSAPWACVCKAGYHVSTDNRRCETSNIALVGTMNIEESVSTKCVNFTNDDCIIKYGEQAFCRDEKCYCNRRLSFQNADKCESFSKYTFPGVHERDAYSCNADKDCGNKANVICGYLNDTTDYKVCHCKEGFLLDPQSQICVENRCDGGCSTSLNFVCRGYQCVCKMGYYFNGRACVEIPYKLQLDQPCNRSAEWIVNSATTMNDSLFCNTTCDRAQCKPAYRPEGLQCVQYQLGNDKCFYRESICREIDENSICSRDENKCLCRPSYYLFEQRCVRAVGSTCTSDEQCGAGMSCNGQRCRCTEPQRVEDTTDIYGRPMQICVDTKTNGMNQIRFSPILFFVLARIFFT